ncbi:MAG: ATP-binding cassette domain-containing protein [Verrucomicrobiota bacterium]|jgi:ABC-type transporter Mla maintaining outer membrane lipid asymmetry ATPase subunit MlaF
MSENSKTAVIEMLGAEVCSMRETGLATLADVNWTVAPGEFWVVAGQQQSGKSDLMMMTAGLMPPAKGSCKIFGIETQSFGEAELADRLRVGFVFENGQLFNRLTIAENVALPLQYHKDLPPGVAEEKVRALLELLELKPLADVTPSNVGVSWLKRAALARSLILQPELLLLDNPLNGLGARHAKWWLHFLDQLWRGHEWSGGKPMTIVATAEDLRPWKNDARRFALLREKKFSLLGSWSEVASQDDTIVMELMEVSLDTTMLRKE